MSRIIEIDGGDFIEANIYWSKEYIEKKNEYGVKWNESTGKYNPCLHVSTWHAGKTSGMMSSGLGDFYPFEDVSVSRRVIKPLTELSNSIDANDILDLIVNKDIKAIF